MKKEFLKKKRNNSDKKITEDEEEEYEVEHILDKKLDVKNNQVLYLIKWIGYGNQDNTWEPLRNLTNCLDLVERFDIEKEEGEDAKSKKSNKKENSKSKNVNRSSSIEKKVNNFNSDKIKVNHQNNSNAKKKEKNFNLKNHAAKNDKEEKKLLKFAMEKSLAEYKSTEEMSSNSMQLHETNDNGFKDDENYLKKAKKNKKLNSEDSIADNKKKVNNIGCKNSSNNPIEKEKSSNSKKKVFENKSDNLEIDKSPQKQKIKKDHLKNSKSKEEKISLSTERSLDNENVAEEISPKIKKLPSSNNKNKLNLEKPMSFRSPTLSLNEESDNISLMEDSKSQNEKPKNQSPEISRKKNLSENSAVKAVLNKFKTVIDDKKNKGRVGIDGSIGEEEQKNKELIQMEQADNKSLKTEISGKRLKPIKIQNLKINDAQEMLFKVLFLQEKLNSEMGIESSKQISLNVPHNELKEKYPIVLIEYYESKLKFK